MKVILINGSYRNEGCTYTALREIEKTLIKEGIDTEIFNIGTGPISGCLGCGYCSKHTGCRIDDSVNDFLKKLEGADGFVFGSPVHYASISGAMSSFMDRVFTAAPNKLALKPAAGVVSCAEGVEQLLLKNLIDILPLTICRLLQVSIGM